MNNDTKIIVKEENKYDVVIIGGGPGGYETAFYAYKNDLKVCLIEEKAIGGTCLNRGCIPTKTLYYLAKTLKEMKKASEYGLEVEYHFDYAKLANKKDQVINDLQKGIEFLIDKSEITYEIGHGKIISNNEVLVNDKVIQGENIIIATGSSPLTGFIKGDKNVITSNELLSLTTLPKSLTIIGAGVIGIEMASIYRELGCEVEVVEMADCILPNLDKEISKRLLSYLQKLGVKFHLKSLVQEIIDKNSLSIIEKEQVKILNSEYILMAVGRKINIDNLFDNKIKIDYDRKGIKVDNNYMTSIPHIYAIGDVIGKIMLAHFATYSGRKVIDTIISKNNNTNFSLCPGCIFTFPEVSYIGLTEEQAREQGYDYQVMKSFYRANGKALSMSEVDGFIKCLICNDQLIGVHIIGVDASVIIHEASIIMNKEIKVSEISDYIYAHPTLSEIFKSCFNK